MSNMTLTKFVLNKSGVRELLRSPEAASVCEELAQQAVSKLGNGYATNTYTGTNRVNVSVYPETKEAIDENSEHNTLLTTLGPYVKWR